MPNQLETINPNGQDSKVNELDYRIVSLSDCWIIDDRNASNGANLREPTRSEKVTALVQLMRSHYTKEDHYIPAYVARLSENDPQMIFVALSGTSPIGTNSAEFT